MGVGRWDGERRPDAALTPDSRMLGCPFLSFTTEVGNGSHIMIFTSNSARALQREEIYPSTLEMYLQNKKK